MNGTEQSRRSSPRRGARCPRCSEALVPGVGHRCPAQGGWWRDGKWLISQAVMIALLVGGWLVAYGRMAERLEDVKSRLERIENLFLRGQ